jgi:hypothetical protein
MRRLDQPLKQVRIDRFIGEFAKGAVASQKVDCMVHLEGPGLVNTPFALADFAKQFKLMTLSSKPDAARRFWPFPSGPTAVTVIT